jgi:hypothetical protein
MKKISALLFVLILVGCDANPTPEALKDKLKARMTQYLYEGKDSTKVKFHVLDVLYYDDKQRDAYDCQFKVLMTQKGIKDTTGYMFAYISKDFKKVNRTDLLER